MKFKLTLLTLTGSLALAAPALLAQSTSTNDPSHAQAGKYQAELEKDRALGERALLPLGLKEKMNLTDEQRTELKAVEKDFAKISLDYQTANQPRIDAAQEANRQARESKDTARIETARLQLQQVRAGLQPYRETAILKQVKQLLTPEQLKILEDPKNAWPAHPAIAANDPSAH